MGISQELAKSIYNLSTPTYVPASSKILGSLTYTFNQNLDRVLNPIEKEYMTNYATGEYKIDPERLELIKRYGMALKAMGREKEGEKWINDANAFDEKIKEYRDLLKQKQEIESGHFKIKGVKKEKITKQVPFDINNDKAIEIFKKHIIGSKVTIEGGKKVKYNNIKSINKKGDKVIFTVTIPSQTATGIRNVNIPISVIDVKNGLNKYYESIPNKNSQTAKRVKGILDWLENKPVTETETKEVIKHINKEQLLQEIKDKIKKVQQEFKQMRKDFNRNYPGKSEIRSLLGEGKFKLYGGVGGYGGIGKEKHDLYLKDVANITTTYKDKLSKSDLPGLSKKTYESINKHFLTFAQTLMKGVYPENSIYRIAKAPVSASIDRLMIDLKDLANKSSDELVNTVSNIYKASLNNVLNITNKPSKKITNTEKVLSVMEAILNGQESYRHFSTDDISTGLTTTIYNDTIGTTGVVNFMINPEVTTSTLFNNIKILVGDIIGNKLSSDEAKKKLRKNMKAQFNKFIDRVKKQYPKLTKEGGLFGLKGDIDINDYDETYVDFADKLTELIGGIDTTREAVIFRRLWLKLHPGEELPSNVKFYYNKYLEEEKKKNKK